MLVSLSLVATSILVGCNGEPPVEPADLIFAGGAVFTSDPEQPNASAVAVAGNVSFTLATKPALNHSSAPYPKNRYWRWTPHIGTYGFTHPRL